MRWVWLVAMGCVTRGELEAALDRDGDGYLPVVAGGPDCDETRAEVNPGAVEACGDGIDNDCDGRIDDAGVGERTWYRDDDGDGFGIDETVRACSEPEGYAPVLGDCVDDDASINPGVLDLCDGIDQDCDGRIDDDVDALVQYRDADGDGFGTDSDTLTGCGQTPGYVLVSGDCDDAVAAINPAVEDTCDGVDQNCNGVVDEDVAFTVQYRDADGDGDGNPFDVVSACELLPGYVGTANDCDDQDPTRFTNAFDYCDGIDQDCDGIYDDDVPFAPYYLDEDGDGAGSEPAVADSCEPVPGLTTVLGDCDDHDDTISPLLADTCDGVDSDCDGAIDDDALLTLYFPDADEDGVGTTLGAVEACIPPPGFVQLDGDCDDHDPTVRPDSLDGCDGIDTDCDGAIDDDATFTLWWNDHDGDGVGTGPSAYTCDPPAGAAAVDGDCNDADPDVRPGATDACDGADEDCDGAIDEDAPFALWWTDEDGDGVGTGTPVYVCQAPDDAAQADGDCDDEDPNVRPGITDACDGVDSDCDGVVDQDATFALWFRDTDGDGLGRTNQSVSTCDGAPTGYVATPGDCDDADSNVTIPVWYRDDDDDGWGVEDEVVGCVQPAGFSDRLGDCDDADGLRNPGLAEVCNNHRDDDCDAATDCRRLGSWERAEADRIFSALGAGVYTLGSADVVGGPASDWVVRRPDGSTEFHEGSSTAFDTASETLAQCDTPVMVDNVVGSARADVVCLDDAGTTATVYTGGSLTLTSTLTSTAPIRSVQGSSLGLWITTSLGGHLVQVPISSGALPPPRVSGPNLTSGAVVEMVDGTQALVIAEAAGDEGWLRVFDSVPTSDVAPDEADANLWVEGTVDGLVFVHTPAGQPVYATAWRDAPTIGVTWFEWSGSQVPRFDRPTFQSSLNQLLPSFPAGDLDADGASDWVMHLPTSTTPQSMVRYGVSEGAVTLGSDGFDLAEPVFEGSAGGGAGDVDGDGYADIAFWYQGSIYVFYGQGQ